MNFANCTEETYQEKKLRITDSLAESPQKERFEIIRGRLKNMNALSSSDNLENFIYLTLYLHNIHVKEANTRKIEEIKDIAYQILNLEGIKPTNKKTAFLFHDLHKVVSSSYSKHGNFWKSLVEEQIANTFFSGRPTQKNAALALSLANKLQKRAQYASSEKLFLEAEHSTAQLEYFTKARIGRISSMRLQGKLADASELIQPPYSPLN